MQGQSWAPGEKEPGPRAPETLLGEETVRLGGFVGELGCVFERRRESLREKQTSREGQSGKEAERRSRGRGTETRRLRDRVPAGRLTSKGQREYNARVRRIGSGLAGTSWDRRACSQPAEIGGGQSLPQEGAQGGRALQPPAGHVVCMHDDRSAKGQADRAACCFTGHRTPADLRLTAEWWDL